jgi:large subunit ribosomal protein L31e
MAEETKQPEHKHEEKTEQKKHEEKKVEKLTDKIKQKSESKEAKVILEREYVIPLRRGTETVPRYKKARKAIKVIREFLARHMKTEDRNPRLVKIDTYLNNEIWFRGIKHIPSKIKVKAKKMDSGEIIVELADIPEIVKFRMAREKRQKDNIAKSSAKMPKHEAKEQKVETTEEKQEEQEKEAAVVEAGLKAQKLESKEMKHTSAEKPDQKMQVHKFATKR